MKSSVIDIDAIGNAVELRRAATPLPASHVVVESVIIVEEAGGHPTNQAREARHKR